MPERHVAQPAGDAGKAEVGPRNAGAQGILAEAGSHDVVEGVHIQSGDLHGGIVSGALRGGIKRRIAEGTEIFQIEAQAQVQGDIGQRLPGVLEVKTQIVPHGGVIHVGGNPQRR